jgi:accessory gene regulator protein AgrB
MLKQIKAGSTVYDANNFVEVAKKFVSKIKVWEVKQADVEAQRIILEEHWKNCVTLKGTIAFHSFKTCNIAKHLECAISSIGDGIVIRKIEK